MPEYEQAVFISYAWGGKKEEIVNEIDQALQQRGIKIIRDRRNSGYKGSIKEFMERIGHGNCVIVVISDEYLRSPNCMFELIQIADNKQFYDRVFPVVLSDADIYDPFKRVEYVKYWEKKRTELATAMHELDPANLQGLRDDMDIYSLIRDKVSGITSILKDMNTLTPEMHRDANFSDLYVSIIKRMKASDAWKISNVDQGYFAANAINGRDPKKDSGKINFKPVIFVVALCLFIGVLYFSKNVAAFLTPQVSATLPAATSDSVAATSTPAPVKTLITDTVPMAYIPAGSFLMGSNQSSEEQPVRSIYLDAYYIDKYEVTNSAYKRCVNAGICKPPRQNNSSTHPAYYNTTVFEEYPVIYVNWNMAQTYCTWRGARLPTESEWEKAARGMDERTYPWGESIKCPLANYFGCVGDTTRVGSYGSNQSPYGLYDMAGNVWEWVADWYSAAYYQNSPSANPLGPDTGVQRVLRGGSWDNLAGAARSTSRSMLAPTDSSNNIGFRCARPTR